MKLVVLYKDKRRPNNTVIQCLTQQSVAKQPGTKDFEKFWVGTYSTVLLWIQRTQSKSLVLF